MTFMEYGIVFIATIFCCEFFLRLRLFSSILNLIRFVKWVLKIMTSPRVSDYWKQSVSLVYAEKLIKLSILIFLKFTLSLLPLFITFGILSGLRNNLNSIFSDTNFLIYIVSISVIYFYVRLKFYE